MALNLAHARTWPQCCPSSGCVSPESVQVVKKDPDPTLRTNIVLALGQLENLVLTHTVSNG